MIVPIPGVLTRDDVRAVWDDLAQAQWNDGRATAGYHSAQSKRNDQVAEDDPSALRAGERILTALERNPLFISAALPLRVFPPLFNRYRDGQAFGDHVDNAIRQTAQGRRVRTDLSATLFLSEPADYDGGELVVDAPGGGSAVKLGAGDMILYPARSVHRVTAVTRGARLAAFFWVQSMVRDDVQRETLFALDAAIRTARDHDPAQAALVQLLNVYHNLVRTWAEC